MDLYDAETREYLLGGDTSTKITIIDDDKPGELVFADKRALKHPSTESVCRVVVQRIHGCDGKIKCNYRTIEMDKSDKTAVEGVDFKATSGVLEFENGEVTKSIEIPILQKKNE